MAHDDDAPLSRDEYDDRPRPRKSGGSGLVIGLVVGCGFLFIMLLIGGILVGLLLPAVSKVREAASRAQDQNNMKQIALGFYGQEDNQSSMSALGRDRSGKTSPGLSWRVGLLPYIEQESLYSGFDFTQAWDSPRNQSHSNTTVTTYRTPFDTGAGTNTPYRVFVGGGALFDPDGKPIRMSAVTDGSQNTILMVHAQDQVPWAQPKELTYSPTAPLPALGHTGQPNGANVALVDGSVRFLNKNTSETVIRALITRAANDQVPVDW